MTTPEQEASISQWPDAGKDDFTDEELSDMERETEKCAMEFQATVERWAEAASKLIQRQVKVV